MMLRFWFFTFSILGGFHLTFAQQVAVSIPINFSLAAKKPYVHTLQLSKPENAEFLALSVNLKGPNINVGDVTLILSSGEKEYTLAPFSENDLPDPNIFISQMIYLQSTENTGTWTLKLVKKNNTQLPENVTGFIRVFAPGTSDDYIHESNDENASTSACTCPMPPYVPRSVWGSSFNLGPNIFLPPAIYTNVTHLIVHHSAGTNTSNNWKGVVASIFDFHVNTNGWQDVGYNWLIDPNGEIYEGRGGGDNVKGAHMCGYNNNSMAVCMLGNFDLVEPTEAMLKALENILAYKACKESISADGSSNIVSYSGHMHHISGHKDGCSPNYTTCPGQFLYSKLSTVRVDTKNHIETSCVDLSSTSTEISRRSNVYPIPAVDVLCADELDAYQIYSIQGINLTTHTLKKDLHCIDISRLTPGIYYMVMLQGHQVKTSKFVKI